MSTKPREDPYRPYDLAPDGRFVMIRMGDGADTGELAPDIVLVQNWTAELERLVPTR